MEPRLSSSSAPVPSGPIAVFDCGIGSYGAVQAIRRRHPRQDVIYLADRASFPYGAKSRDDMREAVRRTLVYLDRFAPAAILVASNAPSVTVLDELTDAVPRPIFGVLPPIATALSALGDGDLAVIGVRSMVTSPQARALVVREAGPGAARVHLADASSLVECVESGRFLHDRAGTAAEVERFLGGLEARHPRLAGVTLSSTHLPWLRDYFEAARPSLRLFDPIEDAASRVAPYCTEGGGSLRCLVTENATYPASDFAAMATRLGLSLDLERVSF